MNHCGSAAAGFHLLLRNTWRRARSNQTRGAAFFPELPAVNEQTAGIALGCRSYGREHDQRRFQQQHEE
jgi:hypothetical protein